MLTLTQTVGSKLELDFRHYGPFTYVICTDQTHTLKFVEEKRVGRYIARPKQTVFCITRKLYEAKKNKPFFFVNVPREDQFEAMSHKFFKAYQAGIGWKVEFIDWHVDLHQSLKSGKFERIVKNRYMNDHTLLDSKDRIVYHRVRIDYTQGQVKDGSYHIDDLAKHLKKRKDVTDVDIINIPYYNAEFSGERAIEFTYIPPMSRWSQFVKWYYPDTVSSKYTLFEKLGVDKFRKKD